jgi:hypothetical protein
MSRQPENARDYPEYMVLDAEREADEAAAARERRPVMPLSIEALATLRECFARRAREDRERDERVAEEMKP